MNTTEIVVAGPCRGRNVSLAMDVLSAMESRGVAVKLVGADAHEASALEPTEVVKMTDESSDVVLIVKDHKTDRRRLTPEQLLAEWTNDGGPHGWLFRNGMIMGDKPSEKQFLDLIQRARDTA